MANKKTFLLRLLLGCILGTGICYFQTFLKEEPQIQGEFSVQVTVPKKDTSVHGTDIGELSKEVVAALLESQYKDALDTEEIRNRIESVSALIPETIQTDFPIEQVTFINEAADPYIYYVSNSSPGQIIASDQGIFPEYYTLAAIGRQVDIVTNASSSPSFEEAFEKENEKAWNYCSSVSEAFSYQFAGIVLGGYVDKWNELHSPLMHQYVKDAVLNYEYLREQYWAKLNAQYAFEDYISEKSTYSNEERLEATLSILPEGISNLLQEKGVSFVFVDDLQYVKNEEDAENAIILGCFGGDEQGNPQIKLLKENPYMESTILHEIGHFVDWCSGYEYREQFKYICKEEFKSCLWAKPASHTQKYSSNYDEEYFADAFAYYLLDCKEISDYWVTYAPKTSIYLLEIVNKLNSEN